MHVITDHRKDFLLSRMDFVKMMDIFDEYQNHLDEQGNFLSLKSHRFFFTYS